MDGFVLVFLLAILAVVIYIEYRFLRTLRDVLRAVREQNRAMSPGRVWLNWIPLFNLAWMFVTVVKIRESARAEFVFRGLPSSHGDTGFRVGIAYAVLCVVPEVAGPFEGITNEGVIGALLVVSGLVAVAGLVCWIVYWVQAAALRDQLVSAMPVAGSPAMPGGVGYQPQPWQQPPQAPQQSPQTSQPQQESWQTPPQSPSADQSQGDQSSRVQSGPWLGGQHAAASTVTCASCGAVGQTQGGMCNSCGQSVNPARSQAQSPANEVGSVPGNVNCPYCGTSYRANAGYCSLCGRPAPR